MGRFRDVTYCTLVNKFDGVQLESGPSETIRDKLDGGSDSWMT